MKRTSETTEAAPVSFRVSREDIDVIAAIVTRAIQHGLTFGRDRIAMTMDIVATHANGCALDLDRLLGADDFTFSHDIAGIAEHIDRTTGQLGDCFVPRCVRPQPAGAAGGGA